MSTPSDFPSFAALRAYGRDSSRALADFIDGVAVERLSDRIQMPLLLRTPPFSLTVAEALTQAVLHSQWHRGQNATRLRELGGEPPTLDLIIWYANDRPPARWDNPR